MKFAVARTLLLAVLFSPLQFTSAQANGALSGEMSSYVTITVERALTFNHSDAASFLDAKGDFTQVGWYLFTEMMKTMKAIDAKEVPTVGMSFLPKRSPDLIAMDRVDVGVRILGTVHMGSSTLGNGGVAKAYTTNLYVGYKLDKNSPKNMPRFLIHNIYFAE